MSKAAKSELIAGLKWLDGETLQLPPVVNVTTVPLIIQEVARSKALPSAVDFSQVSQADSVALAMLLAWQKEKNGVVKLSFLTSELSTLLHLYDLEDTLEYTEQ